MVEEKLTKEIAQKLMEIKIEVRGAALKTDSEFVLQKEGKEALQKVEEKTAEVGYPIKYKNIKSMDFYPIGLDAISILAIKEILNLDEKQIGEMGAAAVKFSLLTKIFIKYFGSLGLVLGQVSKMWHEYYSGGDLEIPDFSEEKKYIILRLRNFTVHPIYCVIFRGYFPKIVEIVVKSPATCRETKCNFKNDEYHEFLIKW